MAIEDAFRLGKGDTCRPVLVKFIATRWVKQVFTKVRNFKDKNLAISNDRTPEERIIRRHKLLQAKNLQSTEDKGSNSESSSTNDPKRNHLNSPQTFSQNRKWNSKATSLATPSKRGRRKTGVNEVLGSQSMVKFLSHNPPLIDGEQLPLEDLTTANEIKDNRKA